MNWQAAAVSFNLGRGPSFRGFPKHGNSTLKQANTFFPTHKTIIFEQQLMSSKMLQLKQRR
jgi:hypothetical protein